MLDGKLANPGPFFAEIDSFDLGRESSQRQSIFDTPSEYRNYISDLSGIRVYRDGFGIRVDRDWLELGQGFTSARSFYALKPNNTLGYVALSARNNAVLEETTDREGFKVTPYYENFRATMEEFVQTSEQAQSFLRRGWNKFKKENQEKLASVERGTTAEDLSKQINQGLSKAGTYEEPLKNLAGTLERAVLTSQQTMDSIEAALPKDTTQYQELSAAAEVLEQGVDEARRIIPQIEQYVQDLSQLVSVGEALKGRIDSQREQLSQVYEAASLGLTAEALSHEIHNVADQLAHRSRQVTEHLRRQNMRDPKLLSYTEYVNTSVAALRKQLSHLAPSLRYVREKRQSIELADFFEDNREYYVERFEARGISLKLKTPKSRDFVLSMNRGKLVQVVDNLFLNSEYWLREDLRLGRIERGIITVELDKPYVRISDNGRGIQSSVETSLFEAFVTTKARGKGRGLGLFIVQQLLSSEGCSISLSPIRNQRGSQYVFEIDFAGALHGS